MINFVVKRRDVREVALCTISTFSLPRSRRLCPLHCFYPRELPLGFELCFDNASVHLATLPKFRTTKPLKKKLLCIL
jgi:hypothetical protein